MRFYRATQLSFFITPRHVNHLNFVTSSVVGVVIMSVRSSVRPSVRLSVCLSVCHTRAL